MSGQELRLEEALAAFEFGGAVQQAQRFGEGHINDTFAVTAEGGRRWILQRLNTAVFRQPQQVMENILGVTRHLRGKIAARGGDPERETLNLLLTRAGGPLFTDSEGGVWRCYRFIEGTVCLQAARSDEDFFNTGKTFGQFQQLLSDYPAQTLHETIPHFHDTPDRCRRFEAAVAEDRLGRAASAGPEIAFLRARREDCRVLADLLAGGKLPLRVTHNDTKLNNILIDAATGEGLCVIDLDTVMPGLSAHDYGDSIRFGASTAAEDEPDLSKVHFSLPLFEAYTRGYLASAGGALTELEKQTLPWGAKLMTLECGMRFLTDYLEGDTYFKTHRPGQNLDRTRTQLRLVEEMEQAWDEMARIIKKYS